MMPMKLCSRALSLPLLTLAAVLLTACGGSQARYNEYVARGTRYLDAGDLNRAQIEIRNALQVRPKAPQAFYLYGRVAERRGNMREAVNAYQSAIDAQPDFDAARAPLGRLYALAGMPERALSILAPALARHPDSAELLIVRAGANSNLGKPDLARADAERAVQLDPGSEQAVPLLAGIYAKAGESARALALVRQAVEQRPQSADLRALLADMYVSAGQFPQAEEQMRKIIELKPTVFQGRLNLARAYSRNHQLDDAERVLQEAIKALPDSDDAKLALVDFTVTERSREQGERVLRAFIGSAPGDYTLRLALGGLLERGGRRDDAVAAYQEVAQRDPVGPRGLEARDRIAAIRAQQGRNDEALKLVSQVLEQNARDDAALLLRAELKLAANDPVAAITDLRAVVHEQPTPPVRKLLARAYIAAGESGLAEEQWRAVLQAHPDDLGVRTDLAALLMRSNKADAAVALLEEGVKLAPDDVLAREALARAYIGESDWTAAPAAVEELRKRAPDAAVGPYLAGLIAAGQNHLDESQQDLELALKRNPHGFDVLSELVKLDLSRGRTASAIARIRKAEESDPKNAAVANLLGEVYLGAHDLPQASQTFAQAGALAPQWWLPERNIARAKLAAGDVPGALAAYDAAAQLAPAEPQVAFESASLDERQGRIDQAVARYQALYDHNPAQRQFAANGMASLLATYHKDRASLDRARQLTAGFNSTDQGSLLDTSGWVSYQRGEYQDALQTLERAVQRSPDSKVIHYHVALAELHAGQRERARANLESALDGAPSFTGADNARTLLASLKSGAG
jgi:tetratricopeptide (TPR) repeat protein